ncbi:hypothetical protein BS47DRAFT_53244 [Hydnum rufescens UP504]|uniref:Uncharacterized protein n=1 Tax=Hydnum rufescens UP504 TaxID=1448309 RepID=A0A9P6ARB2_9AGAM|nr:hypothetical protein BS47DRAFT_53244 [Hydnum rufescens UP504]
MICRGWFSSAVQVHWTPSRLRARHWRIGCYAAIEGLRKTSREARRRKEIADEGNKHRSGLHDVRDDAVKSPRGKMNRLGISMTPSPLSSCLGIATAFYIDRRFGHRVTKDSTSLSCISKSGLRIRLGCSSAPTSPQGELIFTLVGAHWGWRNGELPVLSCHGNFVRSSPRRTEIRTSGTRFFPGVRNRVR